MVPECVEVVVVVVGECDMLLVTTVDFGVVVVVVVVVVGECDELLTTTFDFGVVEVVVVVHCMSNDNECKISLIGNISLADLIDTVSRYILSK